MELLNQIGEVFANLFNLDGGETLIRILQRPEYMVAAFVALALIIFTETGLLIGFFLPGDSLLIVAGVAAAAGGWPVVWLMVLLSVAAIVGDSVGYWIGLRSGPRLFTRPQSWFFNPKHLQAAQDFYDRHGGKTIILARFVPFVRTFAPVVAGIGRMEYRRFVAYNIIGGIAWIVSMVLTGYFLKAVIDPPFQAMFGPQFTVLKHLEKVIVLVVVLSITPGLIAAGRAWWTKRGKSTTGLHAV